VVAKDDDLERGGDSRSSNEKEKGEHVEEVSKSSIEKEK
jgi:hypothetical protein